MSSLNRLIRLPDSRSKYVSHPKAIEKVAQLVTSTDIKLPVVEPDVNHQIQELITACAQKDIALRRQLQEQDIVRRLKLVDLLNKKTIHDYELAALGAEFDSFNGTARLFGVTFRRCFMRPEYKVIPAF